MSETAQLASMEAYEPFFGLKEAPFSLAPDPRFLFASAAHSAALAQVAYAIERREPLVVVTGEIGTGKTLLCRTVLQRIERKTFLSVINDPLLGADDLLKQLLEDFGLIGSDRTAVGDPGRHELVRALHAFLHSLIPIQAHAVVIIDEAQHLQPDVLEQIRLLASVDDEGGTLLQIILVGQDDLEPLLSRPALRQLQQRVSRRIRLAPLDGEEVRQYVEHRLAMARDAALPADSPKGVMFSPEAILSITQLSGGLPRVINILCDRALEVAFAARSRHVRAPDVDRAHQSLTTGRPIDSTAPGETTPEEPHVPASAPSPSSVAAMAPEPAPAEPASAAGKPTPSSDTEAAPVVRPMPATEPSIVRRQWQPPPPVAAADAWDDLVVTVGSGAPPKQTWKRYVGAAAALAVVAAGVWFGVRSRSPRGGEGLPAVSTPAAPASAPAPATAPSAGPAASPTPAPVESPPVAAGPAPTNPAPAAPVGRVPPSESSSSPVPSSVTPARDGARFEIVVASFRTESRANALAMQIAALGLPMRQRAVDGWQQVLAGPFASRADAEDAQQRLVRAGITGTTIVRADSSER